MPPSIFLFRPIAASRPRGFTADKETRTRAIQRSRDRSRLLLPFATFTVAVNYLSAAAFSVFPRKDRARFDPTSARIPSRLISARLTEPRLTQPGERTRVLSARDPPANVHPKRETKIVLTVRLHIYHSRLDKREENARNNRGPATRVNSGAKRREATRSAPRRAEEGNSPFVYHNYGKRTVGCIERACSDSFIVRSIYRLSRQMEGER